MRSIQRKVLAANATSKPGDKSTLHAADGIHLSDLGQLAMAFAIIKGLGAPAEVSAASVDAVGPNFISAQGCRVTNLKSSGGNLEFDRLDDGLPVNFGLFGALQFRFVPIPDELNRYMLTVAHLPPGRYDVIVDGRPLGTFGEKQLAAGLNIASATADGWEPGGPWDAAASVLISMTDARDQIANAERFLDHYLPGQPNRIELHDNRARSTRGSRLCSVHSSGRGHFTLWCGERSPSRRASSRPRAPTHPSPPVRFDPHPDQVRMARETSRNHFSFDVARIQQGGDRRIGRHGLGQNQVAGAGVFQSTHGLACGRPEVIEMIVEVAARVVPRWMPTRGQRGSPAAPSCQSRTRSRAVRTAASTSSNDASTPSPIVLTTRSSRFADGVAQLLDVLVDDAEGAGVSQVVIERIGLLSFERGHHQGHHRDRRELARRKDLAGEQLAKKRHRGRRGPR